MKPGNIVLDGRGSVKLTDLGLASISSENDASEQPYQTREGQLAGTLPYMAPEQASSLSAANIQSDLYSLGATWFYLLTGKPRLRGTTFTQQFESLLIKRNFNRLPKESLPEELYRIYRKLVAYQPSERYDHCPSLVDDLEQALEDAGESVGNTDINVLVVEDSKTDMLLTIEVLRRINHSLVIHQAHTLAQGIEAFETLPIDLVLLDLTLPDSQGAETVEGFRRAAPGVPIVVLTGMSEDEIREDCIRAGATNFLSKSGMNAHKMERIIFITLSRCSMPREAGRANGRPSVPRHIQPAASLR